MDYAIGTDLKDGDCTYTKRTEIEASLTTESNCGCDPLINLLSSSPGSFLCKDFFLCLLEPASCNYRVSNPLFLLVHSYRCHCGQARHDTPPAFPFMDGHEHIILLSQITNGPLIHLPSFLNNLVLDLTEE